MAVYVPAASACDIPDSDDLVVAYRHAPPFTFDGPNGQPQGFSVDLWRTIAAEIDQDFQFVACETISGQESGLKSGAIDVAISPFTITAKRLQSYDFSQQYLASGLSLAVSDVQQINFTQAFAIMGQSVLQPSALRNLIIFLLFNVLVAVLLRYYARGLSYSLDGQPEARAHRWSIHVLEAVTRTIGLKGIKQEGPSLVGRLAEIALALIGTALSGIAFGIIASSFVTAGQKEALVPAGDLSEMRVAVLHCSTAERFLQQQYQLRAAESTLEDEEAEALNAFIDQLDCHDGMGGLVNASEPAEIGEGLAGAVAFTSSYEKSIEMMLDGKVDAVLGDWAALTYLSRLDKYDGHMHVQEQVYRNEPYGWAISDASDVADLARQIDTALLAHMRDISWRRRVQSALGFGDVTPD